MNSFSGLTDSEPLNKINLITVFTLALRVHLSPAFAVSSSHHPLSPGRRPPLVPLRMDLLFGRRKTPEEMLRQNQRALNRAMRDLDRERQKLETQEKKIIADIKKMAKQGQMDAVKIMAKDLVRTRRYVKKFIMMRANIQAVSLKIQTLKSNNSMAQAMKGVTKAMATMNRQLKLPQIQKIMMEFEKQSEIMDMKEEMMNDAIDDAMGSLASPSRARYGASPPAFAQGSDGVCSAPPSS
uniref:Charged multivesicular body protein 2A n=1 Tax=Pelodiscus sinensis TaxID=13735 RepID=K7GBU9_PELSI